MNPPKASDFTSLKIPRIHLLYYFPLLCLSSGPHSIFLGQLRQPPHCPPASSLAFLTCTTFPRQPSSLPECNSGHVIPQLRPGQCLHRAPRASANSITLPGVPTHVTTVPSPATPPSPTFPSSSHMDLPGCSLNEPHSHSHQEGMALPPRLIF